ncbi:mas-related G-protein coupled receptor member H-like [Motacilla alba alba]|uniref:mas-related G-protein coupled receptor member H-like n=1 Tax=Motacilla alba alba TaxID=1094192 RepID=UPI0018D55390|nr:mas-related G-protein coupled receptor member H-like [Motacilla alba alba]
MEVTTVFPSPASPAEGDNTCGTDITFVAIGGIMLLICLCGLAGNGALLCLLSFCRNPITVYIFHLAVADFLFLLFVVTSLLLHLLEEVSCSTIMLQEYLKLFFLLSLFSYTTGLCLLTAITIERCTSVLCPLWYRCHRPKHLSRFMSVLLWALPFVTVVILCLSLKPHHCQVSLIFMNALNLLFAAAMVISSTILFIEVKRGSQQQQQPKRLDVLIILTVLFVLPFTLPLSLWTLLQQLGYTVVSAPVVFLLACIRSTSSPFICFSVGSCRRPCSLECCRRPCSMGSLRKALLRVFGGTEENTASSNDPVTDIVL